ncbi:MAG: adaptor protein MecA [Lachnospiraceae bacterium]|nr:adaptor protein MecA [Lachnospiraceae bacterium]
MKFEKMENGTLRCTLNKEDLDANGVGLEDFFTNSKNARDFLEKVIHIAEDEVGFQANGNMMSIQASIMSENEIILTFSENQVNGSEIFEHIKNMLGASGKAEKNHALPDVKEDIFKEISENQEEKISGDMEGYAYILNFVSFNGVRNFCRILPQNHKADSRLYYLEKKKQYYLWADLNNSTRKYVYEFVAASMEYAVSIEKESAYKNYLEEHAKIILKEQALEALAQL